MPPKDYFAIGEATTAHSYRGASYDEWVKMVTSASIPTASTSPSKLASHQGAITQPTGSLRPKEEAPARVPHASTLDKKLASSYSAGDPGFEPALDRLLKRLIWLEEQQQQQGIKGSNGRMLASELLRVCQYVELPMDDIDIRAAGKRCPPDPLGKIAVEDFLGALRMQRREAPKADNPSLKRLWAPQQSNIPVSKMLAPPLPKHAYKASELPPPPAPYARPAEITSEMQSWHDPSRHCYELLPSTLGCKPYRRGRAGADSGDHTAKLKSYSLALSQYDRTQCGVLPSSTVSQFARLHGVWSGETEQWPALLRACESKEYRGRVEYRKLLPMLA